MLKQTQQKGVKQVRHAIRTGKIAAVEGFVSNNVMYASMYMWVCLEIDDED